MVAVLYEWSLGGISDRLLRDVEYSMSNVKKSEKSEKKCPRSGFLHPHLEILKHRLSHIVIKSLTMQL